jgi:DNA-binding NarL/FixJ family response regulator
MRWPGGCCNGTAVPAYNRLVPPEDLADRELEVFRLIGQGTKTTEIADR